MTDFVPAEYQMRLDRAQAGMSAAGLDGILLCTEAEVRYFSGFRTLFWQSPTRPWFLLLPRKGKPIAIIPGIGADLMRKTWISDIRSWSSPNPVDEGLSLLRQALSGFGRVGLPMGPESSLRMPLRDFDQLRRDWPGEFIDCTPLIKDIRALKSKAEIEKLRQICAIGSAAFARAKDLFSEGQPLNEAFRRFKIALLEEGAEEVPYLVGGAAAGGYSDVISPPLATRLRRGDVLMLDTGSSLGGYFCDFDRNFAIGQADDSSRYAYETLWNATETALAVIQPGMTCSHLFHVMHQALGGGDLDIGRLGHGLGIQLTEWPSIAANDDTPLQAGMVMTLEPSLAYAKEKMMVHEENILITDAGAELLTARAAPEMPVI